jgi:hypothetical protein
MPAVAGIFLRVCIPLHGSAAQQQANWLHPP